MSLSSLPILSIKCYSLISSTVRSCIIPRCPTTIYFTFACTFGLIDLMWYVGRAFLPSRYVLVYLFYLFGQNTRMMHYVYVNDIQNKMPFLSLHVHVYCYDILASRIHKANIFTLHKSKVTKNEHERISHGASPLITKKPFHTHSFLVSI